MQLTTMFALIVTMYALVSPDRTWGQEQELRYDGFKVVIDCAKRGAVRFEYSVEKDHGAFPSKNSFTRDPDIDDDCQQTSSQSYGSRYDRGQLVPTNHLDHRPRGIAESNFMTNILPMARSMKRGAWLRTEQITECLRDQESLDVIGGVIWGHNPHDDFFLTSHSVRTPDYFWKVLIKRSDRDAIAWLIPNDAKANASALDQYIISIAELEEVTGEHFRLRQAVKTKHWDSSWPIQPNCNTG